MGERDERRKGAEENWSRGEKIKAMNNV